MSIGIKGMWNSASLGDTDFNVHVYSSDSPVHIYNGETVASTQRNGEYVEPNAPALTDSDDPAPPTTTGGSAGGSGGGNGGSDDPVPPTTTGGGGGG